MPDIREMHADDFDAVRRLDRDVFVTWGREHRGATGTRPPRTRANIRQNHADDPAGCFVAVADDAVVGYIFAHTCGHVGWFGTFGIHPNWQHQGIGGALIERSVAYMEGAGCTTVGLATMPDSTYNVGVYMRHGFRPDGLALRLWRTLPAPPAAPPADTVPAPVWRTLLARQRRAALDDCAALADGLWPGLDYRKVIQYVPGETLLWDDEGHIWGFAAVRTTPKLENSATNTAVVEALIIDAGHADQWPAAIRALEAFAWQRGLRELALTLPDRAHVPLDAALAAGYRFVHINLVMTRRRPAIQWDAGVHSFGWVM
ncbi:MAG: GNAT family N-acetyltransferase [Chloroflexi bacterium]|nr:GNAT family N-acetyltransferase [Chloroflexota bacterium]MBU1751343.1 GNAT family N-acetyltransferase [Chloroflexota bacterium]